MNSIEDVKSLLIPTLNEHGVIHAAVFGSFARGENHADSDLDLLVEFAEGKSLFDLVSLRHRIEEQIGRSADVLTIDFIHPLLKREDSEGTY